MVNAETYLQDAGFRGHYLPDSAYHLTPKGTKLMIYKIGLLTFEIVSETEAVVAEAGGRSYRLTGRSGQLAVHYFRALVVKFGLDSDHIKIFCLGLTVGNKGVD